MRRQVWTADEIRDILLATNQASGISVGMMHGENTEGVAAYRHGFRAALVSVAIALGVMPLGEQGDEGIREASERREKGVRAGSTAYSGPLKR